MSFAQTSRFLSGRRIRRFGGVLIALSTLFFAWSVWLARGSISVYVVSNQARLEAQGQPVPVQSPVDGQATTVDVRLGRVVHAGDLIVQLDARPLELQRDALKVGLDAGMASREALRLQLRAEERARDAVSELAAQSSTTAGVRVKQEQKNLELKEQELGIVKRLRDAAAASGIDALHANASVETQRAQLATTSAQANLETRSSTMTLRDREARLASVRYAVAQADADVQKLAAQIKTVEYEIERRTVRSPISGVMVDVMTLSSGMTVTSQQRIATILPDSGLRVIASFAPRDSIGRIRPGQRAILRIDNFPWTQYGTVDAVVQAVGHEPRDGVIRVELSVSQSNAAIPLEHGLTATCEVEVEHITPLRLLLRSAGQLTKSQSGN